MPAWLPAACGWFLFVAWGVLLIPLWPMIHGWWLRRLALRYAPPPEWPLVSIIVPARNEGDKVAAGLRSLLAIDYPRLEIVAIDDRSTDQITGETMDRLAATDSRLHVKHITELPAGWMGKNHAMHVGAAEATGELLLFTDGDVIFQPETIRLAVTYLLSKPLDHLCLNPQLIPGGYWENALTCCFGMVFFASLKAWLIPTRWTGAYCGIGAFNLLRKSAYQKVGGHATIRMDVMDDLNLGRLVKQAGFRQELLMAGDLVSVRWQNSLWGVICGLEKNSFAAVRYSVVHLVVVTLLLLVAFFGPYAGMIAWPDRRAWGFLGAVCVMHATHGYLGAKLGGGRWLWPVLPVTYLLFLFMLWRSAVLTLRQGGIRWRETQYSLDELRENQFSRDPVRLP